MVVLASHHGGRILGRTAHRNCGALWKIADNLSLDGKRTEFNERGLSTAPRKN